MGGRNKIVTNLTNLTTATNLYGIIKFDYDITGGILGILFIVTLFFILILMFFRKYTFEESVLGASFLTFAISIFLRVMELISFTFVIIFGILMAFSGIWVYYSKK